MIIMEIISGNLSLNVKRIELIESLCRYGCRCSPIAAEEDLDHATRIVTGHPELFLEPVLRNLWSPKKNWGGGITKYTKMRGLSIRIRGLVRWGRVDSRGLLKRHKAW
jgi:hypothetical protein